MEILDFIGNSALQKSTGSLSQFSLCFVCPLTSQNMQCLSVRLEVITEQKAFSFHLTL